MSEEEWSAWDRQIEEDIEAGRLDKLIEEAMADHKQDLTLSVCEGKRRFFRSNSSMRRNDE